MKINMKNFVPAVVAVIIFMGIVISVLPYPMAAKRLPIVVSVIAIILSCILIVKELLPKREQLHSSQMEGVEPVKKKEEIPAKVLLISTGWIAAMIVLIGLFGFITGFSLYVFLYCRYHGGSWMESILLGLGVSAFIYFIFVFELKFYLPKGLLVEFFFGS